MQINLTDKNGIVLHTGGTFVKEDIRVGVSPEDLNVYPLTREQNFDGLYGKIVIGAIPIEQKQIENLDFSEEQIVNIIPTEGKYLTNVGIKKDINLLPENIKKGTVIFGVTGDFTSMDTSDATADAYDIAKGKTAYVNNTKITGNVSEVTGKLILSEEYTDITETSEKVVFNSGYMSKDYLLRPNSQLEFATYKSKLAEELGVTPEKVASGSTILGVDGTATGSDTSDADALESELLEGKTAYVKSKKIVGTMPNNGQLLYTPSAEQQIIPEGYTSGGYIESVTSSVDSNIQPFNIKEGVKILGITGTVKEGVESQEEYDYQLSMAKEILGKEIPYVQLEYIESLSDKEQFIDTGIYASSDVEYEVTFNMSSLTGNYWVCIIGARESYYGLGMTYINRISGYGTVAEQTKEIQYGIGYNTSDKIDYRDHPVWHTYSNVKTTVSLKNKTVSITDGTYSDSLVVKNADSKFETDISLYLFRLHHKINLSDSLPAYMKLYRAKIWEKGLLVRDLIPVRRIEDSKVCMYDLVTEQFFVNQGTGDFVAGGEL